MVFHHTLFWTYKLNLHLACSVYILILFGSVLATPPYLASLLEFISLFTSYFRSLRILPRRNLSLAVSSFHALFLFKVISSTEKMNPKQLLTASVLQPCYINFSDIICDVESKEPVMHNFEKLLP
jgi:hypothetical protein